MASHSRSAPPWRAVFERPYRPTPKQKVLLAFVPDTRDFLRATATCHAAAVTSVGAPAVPPGGPRGLLAELKAAGCSGWIQSHE